MIRVSHHYISKVFLSLYLVEFCVFFAAMYFGSEFRFLFSESWYTEDYIIMASFLFATILSLCSAGIGLYRRSLGRSDYELLSRTAISFSASIFILVSIYYVFPEFVIARGVLAFALSFAFFGMMISRGIFYKLADEKVLRTQILIIGNGERARKIIESNKGFIHRGFEIVGCIAMSENTSAVDQNLLIKQDGSFVDIAKKYHIDEIVIALDDRRSVMPLDELLDCKISGIQVVDLLSFYEREKACLDLDTLYPSWLVFSDGFAQSGFRTIVKRLFDIFASLILLLVSWPVMLLTTLAICLESGFRAPVLYRQVRIGEDNKDFKVIKFRSMRTDAEQAGIQWAQENDSRVTRVGGFLRAYRIDELPQIFNVLKGDMSFVGPRPERPEYVEGFEKSIPYYRERHRVKPGITGWAQLCYPYGANEYDAIQKLQYDLYYVKNYSLFLDLTIMLHTVEVILWGKGAR